MSLRSEYASSTTITLAICLTRLLSLGVGSSRGRKRVHRECQQVDGQKAPERTRLVRRLRWCWPATPCRNDTTVGVMVARIVRTCPGGGPPLSGADELVTSGSPRPPGWGPPRVPRARGTRDRRDVIASWARHGEEPRARMTGRGCQRGRRLRERTAAAPAGGPPRGPFCRPPPPPGGGFGGGRRGPPMTYRLPY